MTNTCNVIKQDKPPYDVRMPEPDFIHSRFFLSLLNDEPCPIEPHIPFVLTDACLRASQSAETGRFVQIEPDRWVF